MHIYIKQYEPILCNYFLSAAGFLNLSTITKLAPNFLEDNNTKPRRDIAPDEEFIAHFFCYQTTFDL